MHDVLLLLQHHLASEALQCMGHMAACEGTEDGKERERVARS